MVLNEQNLKKALEQPLRHGVYYYYSTEEYLVRSYAAKTLALLANQEDDAEVTRVEGPAPSIEEAVAAAGTISFFGTKRIVELPMLEPSAMNEADVGALCDLMQSLENAVLVMSTVFKDDKAKLSKKAKQLIGAAEKAGLTAELVKPGCNQAIERGVSGPEIYNQLAISEMEAGDYESAMSHYEEALSLADSETALVIRQNIAVLYEKEGDFAKALEQFKECQAAGADTPEVQKEIRFLESR